MQLEIEEEVAAHRTTAGKAQGCSPLLDAPSSPDSRSSRCSSATPIRTDCPTPLVVRSNVQRRTVGVGEDGLTPVVVREVDLTPAAERNAKGYAPSVTEEVLDFGSPPTAKPASNSNKKKKKKGKKNKKKK